MLIGRCALINAGVPWVESMAKIASSVLLADLENVRFESWNYNGCIVDIENAFSESLAIALI